MIGSIHNSAKAIISKDQHVLLIKKEDREGHYYIFPGGGQEKEETLLMAVQRECLEEIDAKVQVQELAYIREYIGKNHEFSEADRDVHQLEFYFHCEIVKSSVNGKTAQPDVGQIDIEWLPMSRLTEFNIYPKAIVQPIQSNNGTYPVYLGDVN